MAQATQVQSKPAAFDDQRIDAQVLPDIATQAHPSVPAQPAVGAGDNALQNVLPEIKELAQKVGGYRKLAELANALDEMEK
jgi:hypothetical protein